jgi:hypothetical protein
MAHVGIERFAARDGEDDGAQRHEGYVRARARKEDTP